MTNTSSHVETPADSAPAEPLAPVAGESSTDGHKRGRKKVLLAREPSDVDPTRYGDWEKNGRCIDF